MNPPLELKALTAALRALPQDGQSVAALATIVRTRGSTFRRAGTRMLVHANGSVVCELSGGCPQWAITVRAQAAIANNQPALARYNADSGLDVLMEMGCGGELDVFIEPLSTADTSCFFDVLSRCMGQRHDVRVATLFALDDQPVMPRHLIWRDNDTPCDGLDADPALRHSVIEAVGAHDSPHAATLRLPSTQGSAQVLIESIAPPHALVLIGSSATALALAALANVLGWQPTLVDHDPERLQRADLPVELHRVCAAPNAVRQALQLDAYSSVVVMTHNLERDLAYLAALRETPVMYLGTLGSRERVERMGLGGQLAGMRLHAPAGLDIGSQTPQEIALAIAAEILAVIHGRHGGPLRESREPIH